MPDRQSTAMLDCEDGETEANSNCKHCQASGDNQQRYWDIQLDQDLLETICSIYPEWFKDCNMNLGSETNNYNTSTEQKTKQEDLNQKTIDKNKESLKSPQSFHESRQKLERSKMGDILKHKIQKRPDRQELIQQHILEDSYIDNSLQDRQRQLKRARLADDLNGRIATRPGPLELVKVNILHADEVLAQAVRENSFRSLCDTPSPQLRLGPDDDSGSDGTFSPSPPYDLNEHSQGSLPSLDANESSPHPNQGSPCSAGTFSMSPPSSASSPLSILPSVVSPQSTQEQIFDYMVHMQQHSSKETTPNKNRKKTKPKTQPKTRTIKFHEYKGPPNAQKNSTLSSSSSTEPTYDLLLQQQQLQLQWQLEWLQKNPQAVLHTPQKRSGDQITQVSQKTVSSNQLPQQQQQQQQIFDAPASPQRLLSKLEDMKVSDLKTELKKRNLPVSGSKPTLIERLKSYSEVPVSTTAATSSSVSNSSQQLNVNQLLDNLSAIPSDVASVSGSLSSVEGGMETIKSLLNVMSPASRPASVISLDLETAANEVEISDVVSDSSSTSFTNEDIVQLQQRFIEKLQRELERSQQQLQQSKQSIISQPIVSSVPSTATLLTKNAGHTSYSDSASTSSAATSNNSDHPETTPSSESKSIQRQLIHQYLQQKIQHQQLQQRLMQEVQQKQAHINSLSSSESSSTNANLTLTALLERQPMNAGSVDLDIVAKAVTNFAATANDRDSNETNSIEVTEYSVIPIENAADNSEDTPFPGVTPIEDVSESGDLEFDVVSPMMVNNTNGQSDCESHVISVPNIISSRSSSLPSFSALVSCKPSPPPARNNADPQFVITRPPPDYNEATRQLKVKQQLPSEDANSRQSNVQKSSLTSQAVDDVLEILIKNGELPPSAAQELSTPKTEQQSSIPIFTSSNDVFFSKPMTTTSLISSTMAQTSVVKDAVANSPDLHMSLQSVLELTPPSSAGFGDTNSAPTSSLDFDFSLDMPEIEGMDLDNLETPQTSSEPTLQTPVVKDIKPCIQFLSNSTTSSSSNHIMRTTAMADVNDRGAERNMDMDLIQWLEVLEESSVPSSTSSNFHHPSSYGISNDHDPLFSTSAHENLDLFSSDDIDFKPQHDLNFLPWGDKADFTV